MAVPSCPILPVPLSSGVAPTDSRYQGWIQDLELLSPKKMHQNYIYIHNRKWHGPKLWKISIICAPQPRGNMWFPSQVYGICISRPEGLMQLVFSFSHGYLTYQNAYLSGSPSDVLAILHVMNFDWWLKSYTTLKLSISYGCCQKSCTSCDTIYTIKTKGWFAFFHINRCWISFIATASQEFASIGAVSNQPQELACSNIHQHNEHALNQRFKYWCTANGSAIQCSPTNRWKWASSQIVWDKLFLNHQHYHKHSSRC